MEFTTRFELQSRATRLFESERTRRRRATDGGITLLAALFQGTSARDDAGFTSTDYNSLKSDFKRELFPLHSPLLGESLLVSFPPLNYMLKFSGSSCLIGGPDKSRGRVLFRTRWGRLDAIGERADRTERR